MSRPAVVTIDSRSPLLSVKLMIRSGSTSDPEGREGLAAVVAEALIQGGYAAAGGVITKERLAEITEPWGEEAMPSAHVAADTTTLHMTVPRDVLSSYLEKVLGPMLAAPQFAEAEIERIKGETLAQIAIMRHEDLESLGLAAIAGFVMEGTPYDHEPFGTERGLGAITRDDVVTFFRTHYVAGNIILGVSSSDAEVRDAIEAAVKGMNEGNPSPANSHPPKPPAIDGREVLIIDVPNAPAAGVHLGFPFALERSHDDFWPMYVANTWFGTHRDSSGHLYGVIRQERGYNYGNYSYLEHWDGRTASLFQIFNQPRRRQYFSIWVRPIAHQHAHAMLKAIAWELENLIERGLSEEEVASAKKKAKVLYVNLGETLDRLLAAKMDDTFYGSSRGFLHDYIRSVDAVTTGAVNAAIRRHLQTADMRFVVATDSDHAQQLAEAVRRSEPVFGKTPEEYEIDRATLADGREVWQITDEKLEMIRRDAAWAHYPLRIAKVRTAPVASLFRGPDFISE